MEESAAEAISYTVGFVSRKRPFRLKPKSSFLTQSKKVWAFSTQLFSTENSDWRIQSKNSAEKNLHVFLEPIASFIPPPNTHPTATRPHSHTRYSYHIAVSYKALTMAWLSLLLLLAASQRGAFLVPLASSVYHTTAAARSIDPMLPTTAAPAVALAAPGQVQLHERSLGGFRLSPTPPTRWDEGSPSRCSRRKREAQSCQPIPTAVQQYSLTPTASRKSTKTIKSTRLTIRRRTRRIQSKKSPVEKGRFQLAESDCINNGPMPRARSAHAHKREQGSGSYCMNRRTPDNGQCVD